MKNKLYEILVVGSGLSSLTFIDAYLEKNKKIDVISFNKNKKNISQPNNQHIYKILPPQMLGAEKQVKDYFYLNKILINPKSKFFGALEFGGLSNYWGLQIDKNILGDISHLTKKTQKKIYDSFIEIFKKYNLIGKLNNKVENPFVRNEYIDRSFTKNDKELFLDEPILAFQKKNKNKIKLNQINENKDKLTAFNFFKKNLKKKNIVFHDYFVEEIKDHKSGLHISCSNGIQKKIFITKKLILGCGTLITTKLIMSYLNISKEVKINHHPRLFSLYFSKKKWKNSMKFQPSHLHLKSKKSPFLFTADFRPGNKTIIDAIIKFKIFLVPFRFILNFLREHFIFSNIFLEPKYGNLYMKRKDSMYKIYSPKKYTKKLFKTVNQMIYKFLTDTKKIFPFFISYFPGYGADFHYFGTILMGKKKQLSVNEKCQLHKNKKIYLIDGSVLNFRKNKYPLGLIMANSRRVGKEV
jgi:hypothetical protein